MEYFGYAPNTTCWKMLLSINLLPIWELIQPAGESLGSIKDLSEQRAGLVCWWNGRYSMHYLTTALWMQLLLMHQYPLTAGPSAPMDPSGRGSWAGWVHVSHQEAMLAVAMVALGRSSLGTAEMCGEGVRWQLNLAIALDSPIWGKESLLFPPLCLARMMLAELYRALMEAARSYCEVSASYRWQQLSATRAQLVQLQYFVVPFCPHFTTQNCEDKCNRNFTDLLLSFACHL